MRLDKLSNLHGERVLLATALYAPDGMELFAELKAEDFSASETATVFAAMQHEVTSGRRPTPFTLVPHLPLGQHGAMSGFQYVSNLAQYADLSAARECLGAIKEFAARRAILDASGLLADQVWNSDASVGQLARAAVQHIDQIAAQMDKTASVPTLAGEGIASLAGALDSGVDGDFVPIGLPSLDAKLGGWPRGEMTLVAGRPSMGKSALLFSLARQGAKGGASALIMSLEMRQSAVFARMLSDLAWSIDAHACVPYVNILQRDLTEMQRARLRSMAGVAEAYPILIDDKPDLTVSDIRIRAHKFADKLARQGKKLDLLIVDHLGKVKSSDRYSGNLVHETGEKSHAFTILCKELNVAGVIAQQLNRGPEGREDKRPTQADLRDSGNLEQDAHTIVFPYRPAYYLERMRFDDQAKEAKRVAMLEKRRHSLELIVAKNRNGPCGVVDTQIYIESNAIRDSIYEYHRSHSDRAPGDPVSIEDGGEMGAVPGE